METSNSSAPRPSQRQVRTKEHVDAEARGVVVDWKEQRKAAYSSPHVEPPDAPRVGTH